MKRLSKGSVTETLMRILENADDYEDIIIIVSKKDSEILHCETNGEMTTAVMNWHLDHTKLWLLGLKEED